MVTTRQDSKGNSHHPATTTDSCRHQLTPNDGKPTAKQQAKTLFPANRRYLVHTSYNYASRLVFGYVSSHLHRPNKKQAIAPR